MISPNFGGDIIPLWGGYHSPFGGDIIPKNSQTRLEKPRFLDPLNYIKLILNFFKPEFLWINLWITTTKKQKKSNVCYGGQSPPNPPFPPNKFTTTKNLVFHFKKKSTKLNYEKQQLIL